MKKGFTLVELLAILVLLGIIIVVALPSLIQSNKKASINEVAEFDEIINSACVSYVQINSKVDEITNEGKEVDANELINQGFLAKDLKNPKTNEKLTDENKKIKITMVDRKITCTYPK